MGTPISSLPLASTPTGTEYIPIVQSGTTKRTTVLEVAQTLLPITTDEISDSNVTAAKLAPNAVTTEKIADANVTSAKLASGAALENIGTGGITATQLASDAVTTVKIKDANVTAAKLDGAQSGSAPIFGARAWVNFNGTGTTGTNQTIRGQGNVASVYKNGTGDYTITFTTSMPDSNYAMVGTTLTESGTAQPGGVSVYATDRTVGPVTQTTSTIRIRTGFGNSSTAFDFASIYVVFFR